MLTNSVWWRSSLFSTISWLYVWQVQTEYFRRPLRASDVCGVILAEALMSGLFGLFESWLPSPTILVALFFVEHTTGALSSPWC